MRNFMRFIAPWCYERTKVVPFLAHPIYPSNSLLISCPFWFSYSPYFQEIYPRISALKHKFSYSSSTSHQIGLPATRYGSDICSRVPLSLTCRPYNLQCRLQHDMSSPALQNNENPLSYAMIEPYYRAKVGILLQQGTRSVKTACGQFYSLQYNASDFQHNEPTCSDFEALANGENSNNIHLYLRMLLLHRARRRQLWWWPLLTVFLVS